MNRDIPFFDIDKIHYLESVDSTNNYCKKNEIKNSEIIIANEQTAGRGRGKKEWLSLGEGNLFFSGKLVIPIENLPKLSLFSLFIGGAVLKTLQAFSENSNEFKLKWPNDIYFKNGKISGILLEAETYGNVTIIIVGIGINFFSEREFPNLNIGKLFESRISKETRNTFIQKMVANLNLFIQKLYSDSYPTELEWLWQNSILRDKIIRTRIGSDIVVGKAAGFDPNGFLILSGDRGPITLYDTGEDFQIL